MQNITFDFTDKVVIVTGGASGIGKATVKMFADAGAKVVLADTNKITGEKIAKKFGRLVKFVDIDVSLSAHADYAAEFAMDQFGSIDVLVNNAGIEFNDRGNIVTMSDADMRQILNVNLWGYLNMIRSCVPHLLFGGRVVNVSSVQGLAAAFPGTIYQVTKAGILGITKSLALEYADKGITVNAVCPGAISTEGMGAARAGESASLDPTRRRIPVGRRGWPHEVAALIAFLASDAASYMTGGDYVVDGGLLVNLSADDPSKPTPNVPGDPDMKNASILQDSVRSAMEATRR